MQRIMQQFKQGKCFVGYLTAGQNTLAEAKALLKGGVDVLEIGVPFSDPVADGPVIQRAMVRSLAQGMTLVKVLAICEQLRSLTDKPIILFSYLNPILQAGSQVFSHAAQSGIDGILLVDLPHEESGDLRAQAQETGLACISLIAPSTGSKRMEEIAQESLGFIYYVCQKGTTGVRHGLPAGVSEQIQAISACTKTPIAAGFGIASRESARTALAHADAFVVGSAFLQAIEKGVSAEELTRLAQAIDPRSTP